LLIIPTANSQQDALTSVLVTDPITGVGVGAIALFGNGQTSNLFGAIDPSGQYCAGYDANGLPFLSVYNGRPPAFRQGSMWLDTSTSPASIAYSPDGSTVLHVTGS
jgi:hypothetical protein